MLSELQTIGSLPADQHAPTVYIARLAPGSRRSQAHALEKIASIISGGRKSAAELDWPSLRYVHTQAIRASLASEYAPATANRHLAALRAVLKECWRLEQMTADEYGRACDLANVQGETIDAGRSLSSDEIVKLFKTFGPDARGRRDAAIFGLLYGCGLRRAELSSLDVTDIREKGIRIKGKGNKERIAYPPDGAQQALSAWLQLLNRTEGPLFRKIDVAGRIRGPKLSADGVRYLCKVRAQEAGIPHFSPHDLRRSFVSDLLDAGVDLALVGGMAGHKNVTTTVRYDRRGERAKEEASAYLTVPVP